MSYTANVSGVRKRGLGVHLFFKKVQLRVRVRVRVKTNPNLALTLTLTLTLKQHSENLKNTPDVLAELLRLSERPKCLYGETFARLEGGSHHHSSASVFKAGLKPGS